MVVYVPLNSVTDLLYKINSDVINLAADVYVSQNSSIAHFENNSPAYYPDLVLIGSWDTAPTVTIGTQAIQSVELIGGSHPPQRPK